MKLKDGRISILCHEDEVTIDVYDYVSGSTLVGVKLSSRQFTQALSRMMYTKCKSVEVLNLDRINKKHEHKPFEFELPVVDDRFNYEQREKIAKECVKDLCPDGWVADTYFSSQNSFFSKDGKEYARTIIRRWV